jgi:peptidoglycan-N-acetylglucosamine deacetylase
MGRQAAKSHGPGAQVDSDNRPALRRPAISRRVLLAAGGMMLAECVACQAQDAPSGTPRRPNAPPGADPAGGPGASAMRSSSTGSDSPARAAGQPSAGSTATPQYGGNGVTGEPRSALGRSAYDRPIEHIDDGPRAIALTIDDGPSAFYTPQVLSVLQKYGVTATFCMVGARVAAHPGIAREVADAGHAIANHTWTHARLSALAPAAVQDQMSRASDAIQNVTGWRPGMFRAPYGAWSPTVLKLCGQMQLAPLDWSVDPQDWSNPGVNAIVANIMRNTGSGSIILEHDGGGRRAETVAALKIVLPRLLAAGFQFRTA